jgi:predicted dehydrogenase
VDSSRISTAGPWETEILVNLTNPASHYEVTRAGLLAGKHVFSEKPMTTDLLRARELVELAEARGLRLECAPSTILGETAQTLWRAIQEGVVGRIHTVYTSFQIPFVNGVPAPKEQDFPVEWPLEDEMDVGCAYEHAGYALSWLTSWFGPVLRMTSYTSLRRPDVPWFKLLEDSFFVHRKRGPDLFVTCLSLTAGSTRRSTRCFLTGWSISSSTSLPRLATPRSPSPACAPSGTFSPRSRSRCPSRTRSSSRRPRASTPSGWPAPRRSTSCRPTSRRRARSARGRIGQPSHVVAEVSHGAIEAWHPNPAPLYAMGMYADVGVYPLAEITAALGPVWMVSAQGTIVTPTRTRPGGETFAIGAPDRVHARLKLWSGVEVALTCRSDSTDRAWYKANPTFVEYHGDRGRLRVEGIRADRVTFSDEETGAQSELASPRPTGSTRSRSGRSTWSRRSASSGPTGAASSTPSTWSKSSRRSSARWPRAESR